MLTGDNERTANRPGQTTRLAQVEARVEPQDKHERVKQL
jgi:cation transport ATPase